MFGQTRQDRETARIIDQAVSMLEAGHRRPATKLLTGLGLADLLIGRVMCDPARRRSAHAGRST